MCHHGSSSYVFCHPEMEEAFCFNDYRDPKTLQSQRQNCPGDVWWTFLRKQG